MNTLALAEELFQKGWSSESSRHCKLWDMLFKNIESLCPVCCNVYGANESRGSLDFSALLSFLNFGVAPWEPLTQREQISTLLVIREQKALRSGKTDNPGPNKMQLAKKGIFVAMNNERGKKCRRDASGSTLPALSAFQKKKKKGQKRTMSLKNPR